MGAVVCRNPCKRREGGAFCCWCDAIALGWPPVGENCLTHRRAWDEPTVNMGPVGFRIGTKKQVHTEVDLLNRLRKEYVAEGYSFEIRPPFQGPDGEGLHPDAVARKAGEAILIGIKTAGTHAVGADRLVRLAEAAEADDTLTFRLCLAEKPAEARPLPRLEDVRESLSTVRKLYHNGDRVPALLYGWSLMEAAAQRRMMETERDPTTDQDPRSFVKDLVANGLIGQGEFEGMDTLAAQQQRVTHGYFNEPVDRGSFDHLCSLIDRLTRTSTADAPTGRVGSGHRRS